MSTGRGQDGYGVEESVTPIAKLDPVKVADIQQDSQLRTVRVASTVAAGIIMLRPFNYFSTPAGLIFADAYVHENGFTMPFGWFKQMDREITRMLAVAPLTESQLQLQIEEYLRKFVRRI